MRKLAPFVFVMTLAAAVPTLNELTQMAARFAPAELKVDASGLSPGDRQALGKLIDAARVVEAAKKVCYK